MNINPLSPLESAECPICGRNLESKPREVDFQRSIYRYDCTVCGLYDSDFKAFVNLRSMNASERQFLKCAARQACEVGSPLLLTSENLDGIAKEHSTTSISANLEKLLAFVARRCPRPSHMLTIRDTDYPVIDALDPGEMEWYSTYAEELGLVKRAGLSTLALTPEGWARVRGDAGVPIPGRCFVAMAFRPELESAYQNGIRAAVEDDCGLDAVRMLEVEHNDKICDRIIVEIRRAQFVVADFTFQRGGVYFEAGFTAALGRPVIWTCRACHFHRLHFDTRQYNHIKWSGPEDLRASLAARIRATIPGAKLAP